MHERKNGARRLKSLRQVYEETRLRVGVMCLCQIIGGSRRLENKKQYKSVTQLRMK